MTHEGYVKVGLPETRVIEECAEVIQAICKCQRFGWNNHHPDRGAEYTNAIAVWEEMDDAIASMQELKGQIRVQCLDPFELVGVPSYGNLMTLEVFVKSSLSKFLTDDDGHGMYALDRDGVILMSNKQIKPGDCDALSVRPLDHRFTHVVWFNK